MPRNTVRVNSSSAACVDSGRVPCERMGLSFDSGEKSEMDDEKLGGSGDGKERRGLSHKYLRAIRCLLVRYRVYMVCRI